MERRRLPIQIAASEREYSTPGGCVLACPPSQPPAAPQPRDQRPGPPV